MGAIIALELASRIPDRIEKITLINMPFFDSSVHEREMLAHFPMYINYIIVVNIIIY
jgi:pimeloyl-ACP methyl ester carboxylesterase